MTPGIYEILNRANGKRYVGSAVDFGRRFSHHKCKLNGKAHHNPHLQAAWNKYGADTFKFKPILACQPSMLKFYEQQLLDKVRPEYNIAQDATAPGRGRKQSSTEIAKRVSSHKRTKSFLGRKHTAESRAKMSAAMRGIPKSPEHCAKIGARTLGTARSPELRARISAKLKGIKRAPFSAEHKAKLAVAQRGKPWTPARWAAFEARRVM